MKKTMVYLMLASALGTTPGSFAGCSDENESAAKIRKREGRAKTIDVENRRVSMIWIDKQGKEQVLEGTFTDDTTVSINGRTQGIKDIRPGDKVEVYGYSTGKGLEKKLIATKVIVDRKESDWKSTGQRAAESPSQPPKGSD